ncbi:MAG TPA: hypothetical protein VN903_39975 [Polyangia bacterium]|jgi:hypothetical protein|nr:hypothetical protein [Polyangia bacterium]
MGQRAAAKRVVGVCFVILFTTGLVSCAEKTPPPKAVQATAPLTTPVATGVQAGAPVEFVAAAAARQYLLGTVAITSVDRLLGNGSKLVGQAMPLPMDPAGLRDMILSQAGLPPEVSVNVDFASPSAAAFVALDVKGKSGAVLAVPARGPAEAQKIIDALGKKISTRGEATLIEGNTGGRGWLYKAGNVVVLSDEIDALARGAQLTLEARRAGADDVTAVLYPDAIARANGTDVKSAIDRFLKEMQEKQALTDGATGGDKAAQDRTLEALGEALALAGDASSIEIGLLADPTRGLAVRARFNARAGTKLESVAKEVKPFKLDPAVATTSTAGRFLVGANSLGPFWRGVLATYRDRLAADKQKGAAAALAYYDAVVAALAGQQSTSLSLVKEPPYLSGAFSIPLKDAASAGKVATALAALDNAAASALLRAQLGDTSSIEWTVKKEAVGKLKTQHFKVKMKKKPATASDLSKRLLAQTLDLYWTVADTRMLLTLGKDAKTRLTAIATGKAPAETNKTLADAQAAAVARDLFYYLDVTPVLAVAGSLTDEQRLIALGKGGGNAIPVIFTAGGDGAGKLWTVDMTIPPSAFAGIGSLVAAGMTGAN